MRRKDKSRLAKLRDDMTLEQRRSFSALWPLTKVTVRDHSKLELALRQFVTGRNVCLENSRTLVKYKVVPLELLERYRKKEPTKESPKVLLLSKSLAENKEIGG